MLDIPIIGSCLIKFCGCYDEPSQYVLVRL